MSKNYKKEYKTLMEAYDKLCAAYIAMSTACFDYRQAGNAKTGFVQDQFMQLAQDREAEARSLATKSCRMVGREDK